MPPSIDNCMRVKWHTKQKHAFIEAYMRIWAGDVGKKDSSRAPSLDIVDLQAGYGWCVDEEAARPGEDPKLWEGSAVLAARCLREYRTTRGKRLILNSWHPDEATRVRQLDALREAISAEGGDRPLDVRLVRHAVHLRGYGIVGVVRPCEYSDMRRAAYGCLERRRTNSAG